jgi:TctA family transporter
MDVQIQQKQNVLVVFGTLIDVPPSIHRAILILMDFVVLGVYAHSKESPIVWLMVVRGMLHLNYARLHVKLLEHVVRLWDPSHNAPPRLS